MKSLLYLAKYFAGKEGRKNIDVHDLCYAYCVLPDEIYIKGLHKVLDSIFHKTLKDLKVSKMELSSIIKHIDDAKIKEPMKFTMELKKGMKKIKEKGFSIGTDKVGEAIQEAKEHLSVNNRIDPLEQAIKIKKILTKKIYGQDLAIEAVVDSVKNQILSSTTAPVHLFLFLGPPATGKTYLAKTLQEVFEGYEFLEINMQEYTNRNDGMNMFGVETGYGQAGVGLLTSCVKKNPKTIVLLDEFEKAHTAVQQKMLNIFDGGYLNDANGWIEIDGKEVVYEQNDSEHKDSKKARIRKVDFTQTIFVITSNLCSELYNNHDFVENISRDYNQAENTILEALKTETKREEDRYVQAIAPEIISRFSQGKIVLFNKLNFRIMLKISDEIFSLKAKEFKNRYPHIDIDFNEQFDSFLQCLLLQFAPFMDVRRIKSKLYENFLDQITDYLMEKDKLWQDINRISVKISKDVEKFLNKDVKPKIEENKLLKYLFRKSLTCNINYDVAIRGKKVTATIKKASFEKIKKVEDTIGTGAILFDIPSTTFEDIAGHEHVKERLKEIANLIKNPEKLEKFGANIPKGMLLYGAPGTGKTMLAKAFSNYADLPFIQTTANELIDPGNNNFDMIKNIFTRARDYSPSIVFIDEIDTFGRRDSGGNPAMINEFLTQLNGFSDKPEEAIFIVAATNYKEKLDPAIIRPGRIELHVEIPTLDSKGREYFLKKMLQKPCDKNISLSKLVMYTAGMTGAQLEKVSNESSLYVLREGLSKITEEVIIEQINMEKYGKRITGKSIEDMLSGTAYHESGHAIISKILNPDAKIEQITVTPREDTLGFVSYDVENSNSNPTKKDLENRICVALAGRVAQMKEYGEDGFDTGASSDLAHATRIAYAMITKVGMDEELGYINLDGIPTRNVFSEQKPEIESLYKEKIEARMQIILKDLRKRTEELVNKNWEKIDILAKELLKKEVVLEDEINKIISLTLKK